MCTHCALIGALSSIYTVDYVRMRHVEVSKGGRGWRPARGARRGPRSEIAIAQIRIDRHRMRAPVREGASGRATGGPGTGVAMVLGGRAGPRAREHKAAAIYV